ncbi:MAG: thiamine-phosphate kinase, partial [Polyangiales bacterium]
MTDEFTRIDTIAARLRGRVDPRLISRSIGDDCAVIDPSGLRAGERLVWTVDAQVEHVHFERAWLS